MITLQTALIVTLWIMYGILSAIQDKHYCPDDSEVIWKWLGHIIFSPIIFVGKALYGAFKSYGKEEN